MKHKTDWKHLPGIREIQTKQPLLWINPNLRAVGRVFFTPSLAMADIEDAAQRLERFARLLTSLFPELKASRGIIESELLLISKMQEYLKETYDLPLDGKLWIKADHALPVAGSVKARGGIYEVLKFAETLAMDNRIIETQDSYLILDSPSVREFFRRYTVSVGSTGNLGLSIGITARAMGFKACVHVSADAKEWKKRLLRKHGVEVVEHEGDYASAVRAGRDAAAKDPFIYFVDDENSESLFLGYSVAALRLKEQLAQKNIPVDKEHPLFVFLPCGVGGAPGGITFGLKQVFGDHAHCFFAEPLESPCMLLRLLTEQPISVYDVGLSNKTRADGLAVGKASELTAGMMRNLVSGCYTVGDDDMLNFLRHLKLTEDIQIEPSAAAGFAGPGFLLLSEPGQKYLRQYDLQDKMNQASFMIWSTGGSLVPAEVSGEWLER